METHRIKKTGFKLLRKIAFPPPSRALAELCGILAGDGHVGEYQTSVATNSLTDMEHALHIRHLFQKLFKVQVSLAVRANQNACVVTVSSKEVGRFLVKKGMVQGHKIRGKLCMPTWISSNKAYRLAFTRGLFDTDGSVYLDTHRIKGKTYKNLCMLFTNRGLPLLRDFKAALEEVGLRPTQKTDFAVFLRRKEDIRRYFELIGSSNPKHERKVKAYFSSLY